ncbi:MAG: hypothetical protein OSB09_02175 [Planctomycetota bacterium]|nr:hypothetical protein [Planctomycetota bacterium]
MNFSSKPASPHCDGPIIRYRIRRSLHHWILPIGLLGIIGWTGCGSTPITEPTPLISRPAISTPSTSTQLSEESYSRAMAAGTLVGFVGTRQVTMVQGGSEVTTTVHNIYDAAFQIIGSYDGSGATYRFTRQGPEKLGHFAPEKSFQMVSGLESPIKFQEGLQ